MKNNIFNILYLYAGADRRKLLELYSKGDAPDTSFFGLNHLMVQSNTKATFFEFGSGFKYTLNSFICKYLGFHASFFPALLVIWEHDIIVSCVSLPLLLIRSFMPTKKPCWVVFNLNLTNLLKRNRLNVLKYKILIFALNRAGHIVCISNNQKEFLINEGIDHKKLSVVLFGVDKNFFCLPLQEREHYYILSVGKDNGRDYQTFIDAVRNIKARFIIVCAPRNTESLKDIPTNVEIKYNVGYLEMRNLYQNAKFVVVPSKGEDFLDGSDCSGQTAILDAMACGKAVVATYRTWMDDYLSDRNDCLIVEPENPVLLREKIIFLLENPSEAISLGATARNTIETNLNSAMMSQNLYNLFVSIKNKK